MPAVKAPAMAKMRDKAYIDLTMLQGFALLQSYLPVATSLGLEEIAAVLPVKNPTGENPF